MQSRTDNGLLVFIEVKGRVIGAEDSLGTVDIAVPRRVAQPSVVTEETGPVADLTRGAPRATRR